MDFQRVVGWLEVIGAILFILLGMFIGSYFNSSIQFPIFDPSVSVLKRATLGTFIQQGLAYIILGIILLLQGIVNIKQK